MSILQVGAVATVASLFIGCMPTNDGLRAKLENRVRFDMNCGEVRLTPLEETNGYVTSYGAIGCDRRATYVLNVMSESWVMNVSNGVVTGGLPHDARPAAPAPPPPPPPAPAR